jgi:hypothetical protein
MSYTDLERALHIAMPPANRTGRSRYGMGMKTAAFWIGKKWRIQTKKLGETQAHEVTIDVDKIISSKDMNVSYRPIPSQAPDAHIEWLRKRNRQHNISNMFKFVDWTARRDKAAKTGVVISSDQSLT